MCHATLLITLTIATATWRRGAEVGDADGVPYTHPAQIIIIMFTKLHREDERLAS